MQKILNLLTEIYGPELGLRAFRNIAPTLKGRSDKTREVPNSGRNGDRDGGHGIGRSNQSRFSQADVVMITYGNTLNKQGQASLAALREFAHGYLRGTISILHLLPFFPYSSDDGFSVIDFFAVDPPLGRWEDIQALRSEFALMFDFVINHFSSQNQWFHNYLSQVEGFRDFAIAVDPDADLSMVTRPRTQPVLSPYPRPDNQIVHVWTTFSADQIDFNYRSIEVLEKVIAILDFYVHQGATVLRLDAIAYLWKEIGTTCIHLPQTHAIVKLFRAILNIIAPEVLLLTETNVPHEENISYFGNGDDEAQLVYNFTLPPLLLHAFVTGNAEALTRWASTNLHLPAPGNTFLNFTASHDGIGVRPLEGILPSEEIQALADHIKTNGGEVSYKSNPDGSLSPYELNITYVDALFSENIEIHARKFLASQAIQYALPGVPASYIHSLLGSRNWYEGVRQTGIARSINRQPLAIEEVIRELESPTSFRARIFFPYLAMIKIRVKQPAFHPKAPCEILDLGPKIFAIKRWNEQQTLFALTNISPDKITIALSLLAATSLMDLIRDRPIQGDVLTLLPYDYLWATLQ